MNNYQNHMVPAMVQPGQKITGKERMKFMKNQLKSNNEWALKALLKIYNAQTDDEKEQESTHHHNNVGFTGADATILSSFAKFYKKVGFLTSKQMVILYKRIPKYWAQIIKISNQEQLDILVKLAR